MAKRGYKLQEFLAHSGNVNCLNIGKKACRLFVTGGDDQKVNVWSIGKPTPLMSLTGHTSPVESVAFDSAEVLVLAGASSGVIKQWDLEESKMVRTLSGHRSNCSAVEFHPFGEFFASGSLDTNMRIWDIRKKGCIHTYKGHTQGISTIKFSPDGRWVVSGGFDNIVKVWDLTAGKLLHDFKFHEGPIRSLDFHPLEFLLASGSADRTVKFWDLETFELIGSTRPEATGVRAITFHPDGRTLFSGLEASLKVHSWEPVVCHDTIDMGWSTLGDLCIHEGKVLGCSYYQDSVGVWVADISLIKPYGDASENEDTEQKLNLKLQVSSERVGPTATNSSLRCRSPDYDTKEIKNIYVDSSGGKPVVPQKAESLTPPKVPSRLDTKEISDQVTKKQSLTIETPPKPNENGINKSFVVPSMVPRESPDGKDSAKSTGESITFSRTKRGMLLRPAHAKRPSNSKSDLERLAMSVESGNLGNESNSLDSDVDSKSEIKMVSEDTKGERREEKNLSINSVTERFEKVLSPQPPNSHEIGNKPLDASKDSTAIKVVNGVAVVRGRTRSLVERFEKREQIDTNEDQPTLLTSNVIPEVDQTPSVKPSGAISGTPSRAGPEADKIGVVIPSRVAPEAQKMADFIPSRVAPEAQKMADFIPSRVAPEADKIGVVIPSRVAPEAQKMADFIPSHFVPEADKIGVVIPSRVTPEAQKMADYIPSYFTPEADKIGVVIPSRVAPEAHKMAEFVPCRVAPEADKIGVVVPRIVSQSHKMGDVIPSRVAPEADKISVVMPSRVAPEADKRAVSIPSRVAPEVDKTTSVISSRLFPESNKPSAGISSRVTSEVNKISNFTSSRVIPDVDKPRTVVSPEVHKTPSRAIPDVNRIRTIASSRVVHVDKTPNVVSSRVTSEVNRRRSIASRVIHEVDKTPAVVSRHVIREVDTTPFGVSSHVIPEVDTTPPVQQEEPPQVSESNSTFVNDRDTAEDLMETHDAFLSNLRSRLTKLQVVRHFWERGDIKGAIGAMKKLPDRSVQADVISVLMEKMDILNLDLFSSLLPVLLGLLNSKIDRHATLSMEMLLKLVAVFGPVIRSAVTARRGVGVDLHAEQRKECCNQCSLHLQQIKKLLPSLVRRGGLVAKSALELNLVLQES